MKISRKWKTILEELDQVAEKADEAIEETKDEEKDELSDDLDSEDKEDSSSENSDLGDDTDALDLDVSADEEDSDEKEEPSDDTEADELDSEEDDTSEFGVSDAEAVDDTGVMDELKKIYTPILIMQSYETKESCDRMKESFSQANVLTEQNVIKFDNETRVAQLLSVCALLLARKKNSEKWQAFKKAAALQRKMKIEIQKEEAAAAKELARKFLDETAAGDNEDAKSSAAKLLPEIDSAKE